MKPIIGPFLTVKRYKLQTVKFAFFEPDSMVSLHPGL